MGNPFRAEFLFQFGDQVIRTQRCHTAERRRLLGHRQHGLECRQLALVVSKLLDSLSKVQPASLFSCSTMNRLKSGSSVTAPIDMRSLSALRNAIRSYPKKYRPAPCVTRRDSRAVNMRTAAAEVAYRTGLPTVAP